MVLSQESKSKLCEEPDRKYIRLSDCRQSFVHLKIGLYVFIIVMCSLCIVGTIPVSGI